MKETSPSETIPGDRATVVCLPVEAVVGFVVEAVVGAGVFGGARVVIGAGVFGGALVVTGAGVFGAVVVVVLIPAEF